MKVLHVLGTLGAGGAERFVVALVCELRRAGWDVELLAVSSQRDAAGRRMADELAEAGVPVHSGPTEAVRLRSMLWYVGAMRRLRPAVVHLHNINAETFQMFVPPPWRPTRGLVRTVHNTNLDTKDMDGFSLQRNRVAFSIFCSEASEARAGAIVRGPSRVIPYGLRIDRAPRTPEASARAKARLSLDPRRLHFLHMGSMLGDDPTRAQKAHDVLIRSWRESGLGEGRAELHLLGQGSLRARLTALAAGDASIHFHGVRGDVPDWLLAADCFVMPSRWEGLPVAGIEAVTAGLPCIFSRIEPLAELQPPLALWCEVDDAPGLAARLREFAAQPTAPSDAAVEASRKRFGIAHAAAAYAEVYRELGLPPRTAHGS